jgi:hypothetical protein
MYLKKSMQFAVLVKLKNDAFWRCYVIIDTWCVFLVTKYFSHILANPPPPPPHFNYFLTIPELQ